MAIAVTGTLLLALVLIASLASAPHAHAAQQVACVNKKTGDMRLVAGKKAKRKCPKGWRKVGWTKVKGNLGYRVYSADGKLIGRLAGLGLVPGGLTTLNILRNGGVWSYTFGGFLFPSSASLGATLSFRTPDCTGPGYAPFSGPLDPEAEAFFKAQYGGMFRVTSRLATPLGFGPTRAWKLNGGSEAVAAPITLYRQESDGTCTVDDAAFTGTLLEFSSVPAPPDFKGPLRFR